LEHVHFGLSPEAVPRLLQSAAVHGNAQSVDLFQAWYPVDFLLNQNMLVPPKNLLDTKPGKDQQTVRYHVQLLTATIVELLLVTSQNAHVPNVLVVTLETNAKPHHQRIHLKHGTLI
jgi:hypothetical protein